MGIEKSLDNISTISKCLAISIKKWKIKYEKIQMIKGYKEYLKLCKTYFTKPILIFLIFY
jgi:hypothetical protein